MDSTVHRPFAPAAISWLDPASLWEEAQRRTGVRQNAAAPPWAALETLCGSLNTVAPRLLFVGKQRIRQRIVDLLAWRGRLAQALADYPEIAAVPVSRPVVIIGPFRSGTTFLQRLLAQATRFRWIRPWEVMYAPGTDITRINPETYLGSDERIERLQSDLRNLYRRQPELARLHPVAANEAEECFGFLETSLLSPSFLFYAPVFDYLEWLDHADDTVWDAAYGHYKNHLRLLSWLLPGERWLLKSPIHLWDPAAFRRAFPDAVFVYTHRDPVENVLSLCRLIGAHHALAMATTDPHEVGRLAWQYYECALPRAVAARRAAAARDELDLSFAGLMENPTASVRKILSAADLEWDTRTENRIRHQLQACGTSTPHKSARSLEFFGLQETRIRALFSEYDAFAENEE
jgi:hypothetical protein